MYFLTKLSNPSNLAHSPTAHCLAHKTISPPYQVIQSPRTHLLITLELLNKTSSSTTIIMLNTSITHDSHSHTHPHTKNILSYLPSPYAYPTLHLDLVHDLNLNKSLLPASHTPSKYFLNSTLLPNRL